MSRVVILDPCLSSVSSHNYSEAVALIHEARELGLPVSLQCHVGAERLVRELPARPYFRSLGYSYMVDSGPAADFVTITYCNQSTFEDLCELKPTLTSSDFVFFPTVTCNIVQAICRWVSTFDQDEAPLFGMCLMFPPDTNTAAQVSPIAAQTYKKSLSQIPPTLMDRIVFTCETTELSQAYEPLAGKRPITLPIRSWVAADPLPVREQIPWTLAFLGGAREEKGFHLLPEIISSVRQRHSDIRFVIQAVGHQPQLLMHVIQKLSAHREAITLLRQPLSNSQLWDALNSTSLLLLPYDVDRYKSRGSSLFTEARALGIPVVMPSGLPGSEEARSKGIAETFEVFTHDSITAATLRAIDQYDELSMAAERESLSFREKDSGYLAELLRRAGVIIGRRSA